jgi:hypothetical protein
VQFQPLAPFYAPQALTVVRRPCKAQNSVRVTGRAPFFPIKQRQRCAALVTRKWTVQVGRWEPTLGSFTWPGRTERTFNSTRRKPQRRFESCRSHQLRTVDRAAMCRFAKPRPRGNLARGNSRAFDSSTFRQHWRVNRTGVPEPVGSRAESARTSSSNDVLSANFGLGAGRELVSKTDFVRFDP